ncbi:hypothetical protein NQ317_005218 [Molorchus minor]|uniref:Broad-complex n=1 Tax=Molorchus minor TaxID=1323400 RepID=A0ABQ9JPV0_9CUCU|nr:hypothetical protein NQ317_005218 [Molorchus minor]
MSSDVTKQFAVNWNNHMNHVKKAFDHLLHSSELTDVTLYAEGQKVGAHKMLLSACSAYFRNLFREFPQEHPIVVLKGISYPVLADILKFIYNGEVSVDSDIFDSFLQTAEFLQISGLTDGEKSSKNLQKSDQETVKTESNDNETGTVVSPDSKASKKGKRAHLDEEQVMSKKIKEDNQDMDFNALKCEPNVLTEIFPDELSDTLQENSQFSSELLLQTAASNDYSAEDVTVKNIYPVGEQYYKCVCIVAVEDLSSYKTTQAGSASASSSAGSSYNFSENPLQCPICYKEFSHPYSLHHHKPVHLGSPPLPSNIQYDCEICGKSYKVKDSLTKHLSVHAGYTTCIICSKVLSRKTHLDRHMVQTHGIVNAGKNTTAAITKPP